MSECLYTWCTPGQCVVATVHAVPVYLNQWRLTLVYFSLALTLIGRPSISRNKTVTLTQTRSNFADRLVFLRQPDRWVSTTLPSWLLVAPSHSCRSLCRCGLRVVTARSGRVRHQVRGRSIRRRPLHVLPSTSLPRTTHPSRQLPPTSKTRQRRTPRGRRKEPLWAAMWMEDQRLSMFVLV